MTRQLLHDHVHRLRASLPGAVSFGDDARGEFRYALRCGTPASCAAELRDEDDVCALHELHFWLCYSEWQTEPPEPKTAEHDVEAFNQFQHYQRQQSQLCDIFDYSLK